MPELRSWFVVAAVGIIVLTAAGVSLLSSTRTITVSEKDKRMRPAIGESATELVVDPGWLQKPSRGAVVAFIPEGKKTAVAGRAVAVAGDRVAVEKRKYKVNGAGISSRRRTPFNEKPRTIVPRGCVYILFDSGAGPDSAENGAVPLWRVLGSID